MAFDSGLSFWIQGSTGLPRSARTSFAMLFLHRRVDVAPEPGVLGLDVVLVVLDGPAVLADEVLAEVPARRLLGLRDQGGIDRRDILALDDDLLEDREGRLVAARALLDFSDAAGFLAAVVVAGEAQDREALVLQLLVHFLQTGVLRSRPSLRGEVDDERHLAGEVLEIDILAVESLRLQLVDRICGQDGLLFLLVLGRGRRGHGDREGQQGHQDPTHGLSPMSSYTDTP